MDATNVSHTTVKKMYVNCHKLKKSSIRQQTYTWEETCDIFDRKHVNRKAVLQATPKVQEMFMGKVLTN